MGYIRGKSMKMADLGHKLDQLLSTNEYPIFAGYDRRDFLRDRAIEHARRELVQLKELVRSGQQVPPARLAG